MEIQNTAASPAPLPDVVMQPMDLSVFFATLGERERSLMSGIAELIKGARRADAFKYTEQQYKLEIERLRIRLEKLEGPQADGIVVTKEDIDEVNWFRSRIADNLRQLAFSIPIPGTAKPIDELDIPKASGIYVAWHPRTWQCSYVGKAECLRTRVRKSHERLQPQDIVSFSECERAKLRFCEALTIGVLQPTRNIAKP